MQRRLMQTKVSLIKRVRIRSYSGPHFSRIALHSDWIRRDTDSFYAVYTTKFFYFVWKETTHKPLKETAAKSVSREIIFWCMSFRWTFFIAFDSWKTLFLKKFVVTLRFFCNRHVFAFFETGVLKEVSVLRHLHSNSTMPTPKSPNKTVVHLYFLNVLK